MATDTTLLEGFGGTLNGVRRAAASSTASRLIADRAPVTLDLLPGVAEPILPARWRSPGPARSTPIAPVCSPRTSTAASTPARCRPAGLRRPYRDAEHLWLRAVPMVRLACPTTNAGFSVTSMTFRTPGAPLRSASLQVTAVCRDTAQIVTTTADANGKLNGAVIKGEASIS
ncbi:hypothetical protein P4110_00040 [Pseudomonas aeruginosa]|nr:hypothetical protein [Pseudomonas aeruginosa]